MIGVSVPYIRSKRNMVAVDLGAQKGQPHDPRDSILHESIAKTLRWHAGDKKSGTPISPSKNSWRKLLNYYHPVKAPSLAKQSCNLCGIDNTSLLIHSCLILCSNACKIR